MPKSIIKNALVIDPEQKIEQKLDLLVEDGRVTRLSDALATETGRRAEVYDASGLWLMPGVIDMHVHAREPGMERYEDLLSAARAAAAGGVTSILAMPNTSPAVDNPALLRKLQRRAAGAAVNIYFSAAITKGRRGLALTCLKALKKAGALAFTDDGSCVADQDLLCAALKAAARLKIPVLEHPEALNITGDGVMHDCPRARALRLPGIRREAEVFMVLRDLLLAGAAGGPIHLQHLSCLESVSALKTARKAGIAATAETCPHYFTLTCDDIKGGNADFKMKPPLREPKDRAAVRKGLADGTIDVIASDHAPHPAAGKAAGFLKAPFGVIGLETLVPLTLTELVHKRVISKAGMVRLLSSNPARILNLKNKGALKAGMDADLTLIDPFAEYTVRPRFYSKSSNSPFIGARLKGRAAAAMVGGRFVYRGIGDGS
ncbi:MAG: dihydroorotase [Elusimicrobia bacterium]|nr:dihydroorotase [Elusimicrobiota bacterium]